MKQENYLGMTTGRHMSVKKTNYMKLAGCILVPLAVGLVSSLVSKDSAEAYNALNMPFGSPPAAVFPIAWTALYILMGVASYLVYESYADSGDRQVALTLYYVQLAVNFMWTIIFFNLEMHLLAFAWLVFLGVVVVLMALAYRKISWAAAYLTIPYIAWLIYAGYLNLGVCVLNRFVIV